jgi:tetratricopeptide (TPR) repeat protein
LAFEGSIAAATDAYRAAIKGVEDFAGASGMTLDALLEEYPDLMPHLLGAAERLGQVMVLQGSFDTALQMFRLALGAREDFARKQADSVGRQFAVIDTRYRLANLQLDLGATAEAMVQFRTGLESAESLARVDAKNAGAQRTVILFKDGMARTLLAQGAIAEALALFRANLASARELVARDPGNANWRGNIATGHLRIGDALFAQADLAGALAEYESQAAVSAALVASNPAEPDWQASLATAHFKAGDVLRARGAPEAAARYRTSLGIWERLATRMPEIVPYQVERMKASWRVLQGDSAATQAYEAILSSLRRLRDEKKLTADMLKWLDEAERELAALPARLQATTPPPAPHTPK